MMGVPSVSTLASGPRMAVATTLTAESWSPPKIERVASGSSTLRTIWVSLIPIPRAASTASGETPRTPT